MYNNKNYIKIAIMMSIWCQNLWDELILKNEIKLFKEKYWKYIKFKVFTYDLINIFYSDKNIEYLEYFPIWIKNPKNILRNLKNYFNFIKTIKWADKIIIWWWWIMFDHEIWKVSNPLNQWLFRTEIIKIFKKEIIIFWVSIDIKYEKNLWKIKKIFWNAKEIFVRDKLSFNLLKNLWIKSEIILDPVFLDNWEIGLENYKNNYLIQETDAKNFSLNKIKNIHFSWKIIWLAIRKWYLNNEKILMNEIINFILNSWWKIILLPHSFHTINNISNDYEFLIQFIKAWVDITHSIHETYLIYKQKKIDFCLSMRLHSMILSQIYWIKFIAIKYSKKCDLIWLND